jgi:tetratricopeptide (TPR) repeat protein
LAAMSSQDFAGAIHAFHECVSRDASVLSAYFLGGYAAIKLDRNEDAIRWLEPVVQADTSLPDALMTKYGLDGSVMRVSVEVAITPTVMVEVEMTTPGTALLLGELYQERGNREKAIGLLENLVDVVPDVPAIALSLAELYFQEGMWDELASMPVRIENTDDLSADVLRYKARAMREAGMLEGALEVIKEALRSKKRHSEILKAARYERALTYEAMGKKVQARRDLERLYAEDPSYQDVAERVSPSGK